MKMFGPEFVWILSPSAGTVDDWLDFDEKERLRAEALNQTETSRTCTREEYEVVANRTFILVESDLREDVNTSTNSNLVRKYHEVQQVRTPPSPPLLK